MDDLSTQGIDRRIDEFRGVLDRVTGRLVELDADLTWQLLETSTSLRGKTAERWSEASECHDRLWPGQFALAGHLARLSELRGSRRSVSRPVLAELDELLEGDCVPMPIGRPAPSIALTAALDQTEAVSIDVALQRMSDDYDAVERLVIEVAERWGSQMRQLDRLSHEISEVGAEFAGLGLRVPNELRQVSREISDTIDVAKSDPVSLEAETVSALEARLDHLAQALKAERARPDRMEEAVAAGRLLEQAKAALSAAREQVGEWEVKVVVPDATKSALGECEERLAAAEQECGRLQPLQGALGAAPLCRRLESLLDEVRQIVATEGKRLAERDELRAVLTAYRAKANAVGLDEDLEAERAYRMALETLYTAPCDLETAAQQVEAFRHLVPQRAEGER